MRPSSTTGLPIRADELRAYIDGWERVGVAARRTRPSRRSYDFLRADDGNMPGTRC
jgi:hypothetical protein